MPRKPAAKKPAVTKLFVLDTNVLMHDPSCLFRFEEHDIFLPIMTLEELDNNKKGMSEVSRNARQVTRTLDEIVSSHTEGIENGIDLSAPSRKLASGKLFLQTMAISSELPTGLPTAKADNQILSVLIHLQRLIDRQGFRRSADRLEGLSAVIAKKIKEAFWLTVAVIAMLAIMSIESLLDLAMQAMK